MDKLIEHKPWLHTKPFDITNLEEMINEKIVLDPELFIPNYHHIHKSDIDMDAVFNKIREFVKENEMAKLLTYDDNINKALEGGLKKSEMFCLIGSGKKLIQTPSYLKTSPVLKCNLEMDASVDLDIDWSKPFESVSIDSLTNLKCNRHTVVKPHPNDSYRPMKMETPGICMPAMIPAMAVASLHAIMPKPTIIDTPGMDYDFTRVLDKRMHESIDRMPLPIFDHGMGILKPDYDLDIDMLINRGIAGAKTSIMYSLLNPALPLIVERNNDNLSNYVIRRVKERTGLDMSEPLTFSEKKVITNKYGR